MMAGSGTHGCSAVSAETGAATLRRTHGFETEVITSERRDSPSSGSRTQPDGANTAALPPGPHRDETNVFKTASK